MMTITRQQVPSTLIADLRAVKAVDFQWNSKTRSLDEVLVSPTIIEHDDGTVVLSAEDGLPFAMYDFDMSINKDLETIAEAAGFYWEWQDAGTVTLVEM